MGIRVKAVVIVMLAMIGVLGSSSSRAVLFKSTGDPTYHTNAPAGTLAGSGWQYEGHWEGFLGTPIAPLFFVAAKHIGGNVGDTFVLNGFTYHTVAVTDSPTSDLRVWQVAETFPSYAPLYTSFNESGKNCVVFGRGTQRGVPVIISGVTNGWQWGTGDAVQRWGENVVAGITNLDAYLANPGGDLLRMSFDRNAGSNECQLSVGDSSGALFIQDSGVWKLAGIHYLVGDPFISTNGVNGSGFNAAMLDYGGVYLGGDGNWKLVSNQPTDIPAVFYSTRISSNLAWISAVTNIAPVAPVASFTATPTSGTWPLTVTFTDTSTGTLTNRSWAFGDSSTTNTTANILTHTYNSAGTNTVRLIARGQAGTSTNTQTGLIIVISPPHLVVNPGSLNFGSLTVGQTATLTFNATNTGDLLLTGSASSAGSFAIAAGNSLNLNPGQTQPVTVTFTPSSAGISGSFVFFHSNGGDSTNAVTGTGLTPAQITPLPGALNFGYTATGSATQITLVVTNTGGTTASNGLAAASAPFTIFSGGSFAVPAFGSANVVVRFAPTGTGTFNNNVTLTTANGGNATVAVAGIGATFPVANFTGSPTSPTTSTPVTFTDGSTGAITNWFWNFGDGTTANTQNAMHQYANAGTYTVSLTVSGPVGADTLPRNNYIVVRDDLVPSVPDGLAANAASASQIRLTWTAATDTGGSGLAGYRVSRDGAAIGSTAATTFTDTGLSNDTQYCYQVAAYDQAGNISSWSVVACATTSASASVGPLAGTYYGLVTHANSPTFQNSGFVKITVKDTGDLSGSVTLAATVTKFTGQFTPDGQWSSTIGPLTFNLFFELTNHTEQIRGTVSDGSFTSELLASRADSVAPALVGNYTVILPANTNDPSLFPQGDSYGTVKVDSKGNIRLTGVLADGTKFKQRVPISNQGTWPLFALLYHKCGLIGGWVTFTNIVGVSDCDGVLDWIGPTGVVNELPLIGSKYVAAPMLVSSNARLILGDGNLPDLETNSVTVDTANKVSVVSGDSENLGLSINSKTGQFTGKFAHPAAGKAVKFNGVVLQIQNFGSGFFLGTNRAGYVLFEPAAP